MSTVTHARVSLGIQDIVLMAKKSFSQQSSAIPQYCYIPAGLFDLAHKYVRDLGGVQRITEFTMYGLKIQRAHGDEVIVSESAL